MYYIEDFKKFLTVQKNLSERTIEALRDDFTAAKKKYTFGCRQIRCRIAYPGNIADHSIFSKIF